MHPIMRRDESDPKWAEALKLSKICHTTSGLVCHVLTFVDYPGSAYQLSLPVQFGVRGQLC